MSTPEDLPNDVRQALARDRVVDITTRGRRSGTPHRIEIWMHQLGERIFITGLPPRPRSWYANLVAEPAFTLHLKQSVKADLDVRARPVTDQQERTEVLRAILARLERSSDLAAWVAGSPLVEVTLAA
jgi:deazaflavin-dependent oxidoreductase (nitroreductase family)